MAIWTNPIRMKFRMKFAFAKERTNKVHYEISKITVTIDPK